jgi:hypothetical protein
MELGIAQLETHVRDPGVLALSLGDLQKRLGAIEAQDLSSILDDVGDLKTGLTGA